MSDLTPETIAELKRLEQAATKGPWETPNYNTVFAKQTLVCLEYDAEGTKDERRITQNFQFIAALRNAAPALIAAAEECERLWERVKNLESQLKQAIDLVQELERGRRPKT